jgi:acetyl-CoA synthetase
MSDYSMHPVPEQWKDNAWINKDCYQAMYRESVDNPEKFWAEQAKEFLYWESPWQTVCDYNFERGEATWFGGGTLNVAVNCIDRHLDGRADQTALIWEGDEPTDDKKVSYRELHDKVSRMGNVLRDRGVKKGDRVCIYMPMIPEAAHAMRACARIGAVHSVVCGGFSPEAMKDRILDYDCRVVITADEGYRGGKTVQLKANVDKALINCPEVHACLVVERTGGSIEWVSDRDIWYESSIQA